MPDVFISYKREQKAAAEHLAQILKFHGYDVWFDYSLVKGRNYDLQLEEMIRSSKVLLVMWCKMSVGAKWVHEEVDLAKSLEILLPVKIEPCELPVGNRLATCINLTTWNGAPRSDHLDELLEDIGKRVGRVPTVDFISLKNYAALWQNFGARPLTAFALDASPTSDEAGLRDLSVFRGIWDEISSTDALDRLGWFLEQVRDTPLESAVEERIEQVERGVMSTRTANWLRQTRPILALVKALYVGMAWRQYSPEEDAQRFENNLQFLIGSLPALPEDPADVVYVTNVLKDHFNAKIHHGHPIPDDFTLELVFPLPESCWGEPPRRIKACRRPGVRSVRYHREGFGGISEGLLVTPDLIFHQ